MARINIEDSLFKDMRFCILASELGNIQNAIGAVTWAFIIAQKFYLNEETNRLIPKKDWAQQKCNDKLIEVGLAIEQENGVYVCGSNEQFNWLIQRSEAGKKNKKNKDTQQQNSLTTVNDRSIPLNGAERLESSFSFSTLSQNNKNYILSSSDSTQQETNKKDLSGLHQTSKELLNYLNLKSGKNFREVDANLKLIKSMLKLSSESDIRTVIDDRVSKWKDDAKMNEYIRPSTIFNKTNFENYLTESKKQNSNKILTPQEAYERYCKILGEKS